jgi:hypothetical protein
MSPIRTLFFVLSFIVGADALAEDGSETTAETSETEPEAEPTFLDDFIKRLESDHRDGIMHWPSAWRPRCENR